MSIPKCLLGVAWTSALIAVAITTIMFSLFDIGSLIESLGMDELYDNAVIKSFAFMSILLWILLWSSVLLNCFYTSLRNSNCSGETNECNPINENPVSQNTTA